VRNNRDRCRSLTPACRARLRAPYQRARTLILAGHDTAALVDLGITTAPATTS
jgi:hypothetical protein